MGINFSVMPNTDEKTLTAIKDVSKEMQKSISNFVGFKLFTFLFFIFRVYGIMYFDSIGNICVGGDIEGVLGKIPGI